MRVRYGKPIKVKNVSDVTESFSISSSNALLSGCGGQYVASEHKSYLYQQMASRVGHKIFMLYKLNSATLPSIADVRRLIVVRGDGSSVICYTDGTTDTYKTGNDYYGNMTVSTGTTTNPETADTWLQLNSGKTFDAGTSYSWFIVDLTEAFGSRNEPTAQQFYNKYSQYFPLIAAGEEITVDDKAGQIQLKKLLPDEYQEVEYVESPDNQYIDTGKTVDSSCVISFDFQYVSITNKYNRIFGARNGNGNALLNMRTTNESGGNFYLESGGSPWADTAVDTNKHSIVMDSPAHTLAFDGVKKLLSSFYIANNTEGTMWIFGTNQGGSNSNVRFFNYKLIKNGVLEQNLIPCYNKYTGDIGFYDLRGEGKNLCFRPTLSKYDFSKDYLVYNGGNAVYLEAGTYTLSFVSDPGVYIQAWNPNDTSANVLATAAFVNCSVPSGSVGAVWDDKGLNVASKGPLTFTLTNNYIITICGRVSDENYSVTNVQIEKGTAATAYEHSAFYVNNGTGKFLKGPNVSNAISCKIAGGSSDIYYGYNNLCMPLVQDYFYSEYNTEPTAARTYDEASNSTTYTASGGNKSFRLLSTDKNILSVVEGHHYYVRAKMSWNCQNAVITKMTNLTVLTSPGFNIVDYGKPVTNNAYFENIHISKRTGSARWVWSPIIDSGEVQDGDTFTTSDFEIIDLTDWFGPGKEPSTVEEFKEKFTKEYYGFCSIPIKLTRYQIEALPSYGYNQLVKNGNFVDSSNWSNTGGTTKAVSDNIMTLTATSLGQYDFAIYQNIGNLKANDKYIILFDAKTNSSSNKTINIYLTAGYVSQGETLLPNVWNSIGKIFSYGTDKTNVTAYFGKISDLSGLWASGDIIYFKNINIINLTDWYGPGNEPTTVEEFKQTFPNKYYPYSKKTLLNKYMINGLGSN